MTPPPASVQNKLQKQRQDMLKPTPPTGGMSPGAGWVLDAIKSPAI